MSFLIVIFASASAAVVYIIGTGREEIVGWELNAPENIAGLVGGIGALLFGYTEIVYGNEHLNLTD